MGRDSKGEERKGCQGPCVKDTWTKLKGVGLRVGGGDGWGGVGVVGGKWIQLYLNINKIHKFKKIE